MIDFSLLKSPDIIESLDFEAILQRMVANAQQMYLAVGIDYDIGHLESDPVKIALEVAAYSELMVRARINDAAKANLVSLSTGSDLDHLAGFHDVFRLSGETDNALRLRVIVAISGRSTAGPKDWYRSAALRADVRVADAYVARFGDGPDIRVTITATDNYGEADPALIAAVTKELNKSNVRVISDRITVTAATSKIIDVEANIWLLPDTPQDILLRLEDDLRNALHLEGGVGFDVTRSWLIAKLHKPGIQKISLLTPVSDTVVADYAAAKIGMVTLNYKGRGR